MSNGNQTESRTVPEWCRAFAKLYETSDNGRSPEELWTATMAHCSSIGEAIRKVNYRDLMKAASHAFCWLCSYVNYCTSIPDEGSRDLVFQWKGTLCDIVYLKFPRQCGHCREAHCQCDPKKTDERPDKSAKYQELLGEWKVGNRSGYTLRAWLDMFREIYGGRIHMQTLENIGFHFLEEAGEEAKAVRELIQLRGVIDGDCGEGIDASRVRQLSTIEGIVGAYGDKELEHDEKGKPLIDVVSREGASIWARLVKAKMDFVVELADTFSWFCAILIKLEQILDGMGLLTPDFDIERHLLIEYCAEGKGLTCPTCQKETCECVFFPKG